VFDGRNKNFAGWAKFFGFAPSGPNQLHSMIAAAFGADAINRKGFFQFDWMNNGFLVFYQLFSFGCGHFKFSLS
jgi:hypothetical protein